MTGRDGTGPMGLGKMMPWINNKGANNESSNSNR